MIRIRLEADKIDDQFVKESLIDQIRAEVVGKDPRPLVVNLDSETSLEPKETTLIETIDSI